MSEQSSTARYVVICYLLVMSIGTSLCLLYSLSYNMLYEIEYQLANICVSIMVAKCM